MVLEILWESSISWYEPTTLLPTVWLESLSIFKSRHLWDCSLLDLTLCVRFVSQVLKTIVNKIRENISTLKYICLELQGNIMYFRKFCSYFQNCLHWSNLKFHSSAPKPAQRTRRPRPRPKTTSSPEATQTKQGKYVMSWFEGWTLAVRLSGVSRKCLWWEVIVFMFPKSQRMSYG